ncbi:MAG: glycoside hydrolase family 16 protein [Saprospiraceae bacterium]
MNTPSLLGKCMAVGYALLLFSCAAPPENRPLQWASIPYSLVWQDEFEAATLDTLSWATHSRNPAPYDRVPPRSSCNFGGAEVFLDENVWLENGMLVIQTQKKPYRHTGITGGKCGEVHPCGFTACDSFQIDLDYTSGSVFSREGYNYGYFEARIKTSPGKGMYPVFWLWHHDELVVCEFFGDPGTQHLSMHHGGEVVSKKFTEKADYAADFHLYACEWTPLEVRWFFDGKLLHTEHCFTDPEDNSNVDFSRFQKEKTYLRNPAFPDGENRWMGLNISANVYEWVQPDSSTQFPARMYVDYVRVYQLEDSLFREAKRDWGF